MTAEPGGRLRILSIEDEALNRALLRASLGKSDNHRLAGAELVEAVNLADARAALAGAIYDLVLLDRRLPDGDGFDLARELNGAPDRPRILALTADAVPATRSAAIESGCDALLTKPYRPAELLSLIERLIEAAD